MRIELPNFAETTNCIDDMTKQDIISEAMTASGASSQTVKAVIDSFIDSIKKEVRESGRIRVPGLGTFTVAEHAARTGRNPRTGEKIEIPASRSVRFKAASDFGV